MSEETQNQATELNQDTNSTELNQYIFSNNLSDIRLPSLLEMYYRGVFENTVGIMLAKDKETDEEVILLVGVEENDGRLDAYPLAKVLDPSEVKKYASPDGQGGWFNDEPRN